MGFKVPAAASCSTSSNRPSASPANSEMPIASASLSESGLSGSIARHPETWKPPMQTGIPAALKGRAMSSARGY